MKKFTFDVTLMLPCNMRVEVEAESEEAAVARIYADHTIVRSYEPEITDYFNACDITSCERVPEDEG